MYIDAMRAPHGLVNLLSVCSISVWKLSRTSQENVLSSALKILFSNEF